MPIRLGILVNTAENSHFVCELTKAAHAKGKKVWIFFTGEGVAIAHPPLVNELALMAQISVCAASLKAARLKGQSTVPLATDFIQALTLDTFMAGCERHVVF